MISLNQLEGLKSKMRLHCHSKNIVYLLAKVSCYFDVNFELVLINLNLNLINSLRLMQSEPLNHIFFISFLYHKHVFYCVCNPPQFFRDLKAPMLSTKHSKIVCILVNQYLVTVPTRFMATQSQHCQAANFQSTL